MVAFTSSCPPSSRSLPFHSPRYTMQYMPTPCFTLSLSSFPYPTHFHFPPLCCTMLHNSMLCFTIRHPYLPFPSLAIQYSSTIIAILQHILHSHIAKLLTSVNFFHPSQHGFQKGLSCDTQLALFINDISSSLDTNTPVDALFLDFEKAFDKVPHNHLFLKLSRLNLHYLVFQWIRDFLCNRQQFVHANEHSSSLAPVTSGVPQGTVLGPLLFLIYINDLPTNISSGIRLFADDCVLYHPINNSNDILCLQSDLSQIEAWCHKWLMSLNASKTSLLTFHRKTSYPARDYIICGSSISAVNTYKYLGINLTSDLSWHTHITSITNSANRVLGFLRRNIRLAPPQSNF